ncbi:MAG: arginine--tRNA ligase, partial [Nanoarchaeota archaeon]|nr:arginine--tRNA ligase [Nanoarchaeota archaeon]
SMKYAMLRQDLNKTIVFNKKESISFEGNTGPYLLYTYARAKSILRKAKYKQKKFKIKDLNDSEKSLVLQLTKFPEIIEKAYKTLSPSLIANYAHQLAQTFNEFYHKNKVIGSKEESFRLVLVDASSQVLKNALYLLGIETLERM